MGGLVELWLPVRFKDAEVLARCGADGKLAAGPDGFVEFVYQAGGKRYKTRPERFERAPGAVAREVAAGAPAASAAGASKAPARPAGTSRVASSAAKKGHARVVDLAGRRGEARAVQLWTDGACSGNPGPAGLGVRFEPEGEVHERSEYLGVATNNIAELTAILRGLELVVEHRKDLSGPIDVMTDSEYCIGLLGLGWKAKKNQELVEKLKSLYDRCQDVLLVKVKGHAGVPGNERADELARVAVETRRTTVS